MTNWIVFTIALGCALYSQPGSGLFLQSLVLPALALAGFVYLLGIIASLLLATAALCFYLTDLYSDSLFDSLLLPLLGVFVVLVLVYRAWKTGQFQGGAGSGGDGSGGGDIGGCGGSC